MPHSDCTHLSTASKAKPRYREWSSWTMGLRSSFAKPSRSSPRRRGPIRRSNIEKLRSMDPGPRSRSPGTTAHQHVVAVPACARTGSSGDPYAAAILRNCGVWIPGLARARPGRQRHHSALLSEMAAHQHVVPAKAGTHAPQPSVRRARGHGGLLFRSRKFDRCMACVLLKRLRGRATMCVPDGTSATT